MTKIKNGLQPGVTVTPENYPAIFSALSELDRETEDPPKLSYVIPAYFTTRIQECEEVIANLSDEEFEILFGVCDLYKIQDLITAKPEVAPVDDLVGAYYFYGE